MGVVALFVFLLLRLTPGDPAAILAGDNATPERLERIRTSLGLNEPLAVQFVTWVNKLLHGDLGMSLVTRNPVISEFMSLFPATLELSICAMIFAVLIGLPAGVVAAVKRGSWIDHLVMGAALTGYSMPIFWWGLLLILTFSQQLGWTPVDGRIDVDYYFDSVTGFMTIDTLLYGKWDAFRSALSHLVLPAIVLGTIPLAVIARQTRSAMLEVLGEDYVRTARAKGLSPARVVGLHALRNALIPVVTTIGLQIGTLLAGAILTETIFAWPGIGKWMVDSIFKRDYVVVQSGLLLIALIVMAVNLIVDVLYAVINPRIRAA